MRPLAIALLHHPVVDRQGDIITTAVTNLDIHDIARSACTYGATAFYVVHPVPAQRQLVDRIRGHWVAGSGKDRIPDRAGALSLVEPIATLDDVIARFDTPPQLFTTAAQAHGDVTTYRDARRLLEGEGPPVLLLFGTGWGLHASVLDRAHVRLEPILGTSPWNHLSVRAACAITLDRLVGVY